MTTLPGRDGDGREPAPVNSRHMAADPTVTDGAIIDRVLLGEKDLFEVLMRRYHRRLLGAVRAILQNHDDSEDALQEAYLQAYRHLGKFERRSSFVTWLTRIAIHAALQKRSRLSRAVWAPYDETTECMERSATSQRFMDPEHATANARLSRLLQSEIGSLPELYRAVFIVRCQEGLGTAEAAESLQLTEAAVKTRLHRARSMLRQTLRPRLWRPATARRNPRTVP